MQGNMYPTLHIKFIWNETAIAVGLLHNQSATHIPFLNQKSVIFSLWAWDIMSAVVQNTLVRSCQQFVRERLRTSHLNETRQSFTFSLPRSSNTQDSVAVLCPSQMTTVHIFPHPTQRNLCLRTGKRAHTSFPHSVAVTSFPDVSIRCTFLFDTSLLFAFTIILVTSS